MAELAAFAGSVAVDLGPEAAGPATARDLKESTKDAGSVKHYNLGQWKDISCRFQMKC